MKYITKLSLTAATLAGLAGAAFADDQQLRLRIDMQRAEMERSPKSTTIGVYVGHRGVGRATVTAGRQRGSHFELRTPARGEPFGVFVPNEVR